jgi:putative endonuclease
MRGYMYILLCSDLTYYTGSTNNLELRVKKHQAGQGANYTAKRLPVKLLYYEEYSHVALAFKREKQVQGWSRKKKEALMRGDSDNLHDLAACKNVSHFNNHKKNNR